MLVGEVEEEKNLIRRVLAEGEKEGLVPMGFSYCHLHL